MKLPGEAGGNWSERQTKARTYGHGLQLYSARVGRQAAHLLPTLFSRRISDPFAIVNPDHSSSSARAGLFHSSCQLRELEANVEPVKLRGCSAAQGEGCTRERVLVCGLRDCETAKLRRNPAHPIPIPIPVPVPGPVHVPMPDRISPRREREKERDRILSSDFSRLRTTRESDFVLFPQLSNY